MTQFEFELEPQEESAKPLITHGVQLFLAGIFCGSLMQTTAKLVLEEVDEFVALQLRMSITVLIAGVSIYRSGYNDLFGEPGHRLLLFIRGLLGFLLLSCTFFSLQHLALPDAASIGFLQPLVTVAIARVALHEEMTTTQVGCSFLALFGVLVIARPTFLFGGAVDPDPRKPLAVILTLVGVCGGSTVQVILRKINKTPALVSVANSGAICAILSTFAILLRGKEHMIYPTSLRAWVLLLAMAGFGFLRQWLNTSALQHEGASALSSWRYTALVWAVLWEFLIWHDLPDKWTLMGSALVLVPVLYSAHVGRLAKSRAVQVATN